MTGEEIKALRLEMGLSQEAFAHVVGVSLQTIGRWESGNSKPNQLAIKTLRKTKRRWEIQNERRHRGDESRNDGDIGTLRGGTADVDDLDSDVGGLSDSGVQERTSF